MPRRKYLNYIRWCTSCAMLLLFMTFQGADHHSASAVEKPGHSEAASTISEKEASFGSSKANNDIAHERIVSLTRQFKDLLVQETDRNNKVMDYHSKDALRKAFDGISTERAVSEYIDFYYYEQPDGLYVKPTETPPWFHEEEDYDMIRKNKDTVKVTQTNQTDLYGTYTIQIELTYDDRWKITRIDYQ
ncbi:hypothetical protein EU245_02690 [Lentibacillus lipolyticus]|nr:hypothetical protein EU245_02690 [Lentibacillus lipolyticus]